MAAFQKLPSTNNKGNSMSSFPRAPRLPSLRPSTARVLLGPVRGLKGVLDAMAAAPVKVEDAATTATPPPSAPSASVPSLVAGGKYYSTIDPRLSASEVSTILSAFYEWNAALKSGNPAKVADLYTSDAVLLPTISNDIRTSRTDLIDYFTLFMSKEPQGELDEYNIRLEDVDSNGLPAVISNSGIYTFTLAGGIKVQARYTYVYAKVGAGWKIRTHHSSQMPTTLVQTPLAKGSTYVSKSTWDPALSQSEVKGVLGAFDRWNSALKTLDPERVAELYAPDAVLVPTVSDEVRATKLERIDYFQDFLKNEPQGALDEYNIRLEGLDAIGLPQVVSNSGIYTFVMNASGKRVQARFTFLYERKGSEWLIRKHHSSTLPEKTDA